MFHFAEAWSEPRVEPGRAVLNRDGAILELLWDHAGARVTAMRTPVYPTYGFRRERWALRCEAAFLDSIRVRFEMSLQPRGHAR